jgi:hypothetical protein
MRSQVPTKLGSDQAGDGCCALRGLKPWEQAGTGGTPLQPLTARPNMGMVNESEPLVDAPTDFDSTPNGGDMGREITQPRYGLAEGIALWSRGTAYLGRNRKAGVIGPTRSRLQAYRGHLTPYEDDLTENTGRLTDRPTGSGRHEACMSVNWRSCRSSLSVGKPRARRRAAGFKSSQQNRRLI